MKLSMFRSASSPFGAFGSVALLAIVVLVTSPVVSSKTYPMSDADNDWLGPAPYPIRSKRMADNLQLDQDLDKDDSMKLVSKRLARDVAQLVALKKASRLVKRNIGKDLQLLDEDSDFTYNNDIEHSKARGRSVLNRNADAPGDEDYSDDDVDDTKQNSGAQGRSVMSRNPDGTDLQLVDKDNAPGDEGSNTTISSTTQRSALADWIGPISIGFLLISIIVVLVLINQKRNENRQLVEKEFFLSPKKSQSPGQSTVNDDCQSTGTGQASAGSSPNLTNASSHKRSGKRSVSGKLSVSGKRSVQGTDKTHLKSPQQMTGSTIVTTHPQPSSLVEPYESTGFTPTESSDSDKKDSTQAALTTIKKSNDKE